MPTSGSKIDYTDAGKGEPALLLMPGWCATRDAFGSMTQLCAAYRRVLTLDWRGHGQSADSTDDFGTEALVDDALSVVAASGLNQVVPVALSHAGWIAIELRRRLGERVPKLVLIDWIVLDPPAPFLAALRAIQDPLHWEETRNRLFSMWLEGVGNPAISNFVQFGMGAFGREMWMRSGREIIAAYERHENPLTALDKLEWHAPTLHIYAQPSDPAYWQAQQSFSADHPWFQALRVNAVSHFPMLEVPEEMAEAIEGFVKTA